MITIITVIVVVFSLLALVGFLSAGEKFDRDQRKFRKWLKNGTPEGEEPPQVP